MRDSKLGNRICFYCSKRNLPFDNNSILWIVKNSFLCEPCLNIIKIRFNVEKEEPKPEREIGEEG